MTATLPSGPGASHLGVAGSGRTASRTLRTVLASGGLLAVLVALQIGFSKRKSFPATWDEGVSGPFNSLQSWVTRNRSSNFFIRNVLRPIGDSVLWAYEHLLRLLLWLPWYWLALAVFVIILRSGRVFSAIGSAFGLLYTELWGLHEPTMQTIALSLLCVLLCIVIGGPLGVWAGLNPKVEKRLRPVLDVMQSLPTTIYLVPAVLFFGIRQVPAVIATVLFAVAPLIRIAALGVREVPAASVEAGTMFGSTRMQTLRKIQLPQAVPALVTGINQTIMAALSMAVIGAFVGAGGLGTEILQTLRLRSPGRGLFVGFAIVAIAIAFDRLGRSLVVPARWPRFGGRNFALLTTAALVTALVVGRMFDWTKAPFTISKSFAEKIDDFVVWIRDEFGGPLQTFNDFVVREIVIRLRDLLDQKLVWPVVLVAAIAIAWWCRNKWLGLFAAIGLSLVGLMGMWSAAIETLAQLLVAVLLAVLVAIPLGVFVGLRPRLESALNPFFELLQTLPSFVYAIPFVMIFAVGYLPGILATVLYAVPAGVRLVAMAVRNVDEQVLEASTTFGASARQRLLGVRMPMALGGIMLGVNQLVMMAMSMVIITGYIGSQGLGYGAVAALTKPDIGLGMEAGLSLVIMGILLDRMTEGLGARLSPRNR